MAEVDRFLLLTQFKGEGPQHLTEDKSAVTRGGGRGASVSWKLSQITGASFLTLVV